MRLKRTNSIHCLIIKNDGGLLIFIITTLPRHSQRRKELEIEILIEVIKACLVQDTTLHIDLGTVLCRRVSIPFET